MADYGSRPLRVFLSYAHEDKLIVRALYRQLCAVGWLDVWLDEEKLLPGQEWDIEIERAVEAADVVLACLSPRSVDKEGYIQKELRFVLNISDEKPEGTIFVIPLKLEECLVPRRLRAWQWVDYFPEDYRNHAFQRLMESLKLRAARLGIFFTNQVEDKIRLEAEEHTSGESDELARKEMQELAGIAAEELERQANENKARPKEEVTDGKIPELIQPKETIAPYREAQAVSHGKTGMRWEGGNGKPTGARWANRFGVYGRIFILFLMLIGFFGPWLQVTACTPNGEEPPPPVTYSGLEVVTEVLPESVFLTVLVIILVLLFITTLLRLFMGMQKMGVNIAERTLAGIAPLCFPFFIFGIGFVLSAQSTKALWGFWLTMIGMYLSPVNLLIESSATRQKGKRWPAWSWLLLVSILLLPVLVLVGLVVDMFRG